MSSDSQDSDGEDLSTIRPTLIRELRNVLDLYPDDGQILKELIQNAEDAGATVVKVLTDTRTFHQDLDQKTLKNHPHLKFLKGPAMCVYNDAEFTKDDWEGIRMLHTSIKEKDPLKVGRFGLGFKSVFHLTDRLVIMSGEYIMYMDPFKGETRYCNHHRLAGRKGRELQSLLHSLNGVFGVSEATFRAQSGHFPGTLFWFPLRQEQSELSSTVYSDVSVGNLLASFRAEAPSLLLFLNHIQRVRLYTRGDTGSPTETFSVGISSSCLNSVLSQRLGFVRDTATAGSDLPRQDIFCLTEVVMETTDHLTSSTESQRWLVANYHCGTDNISRDLLRLCLDPQLGYRPCVGVAIPLTNQSDFQSQVFCFLPLPLDTRSPTGLPLHVHGYFSLEQNRRHLKWPTADQLRPGRDRAKLEPPTLWNCLLVTELLPRVYSKAVCRLQEVNCGDPNTFYQAWPDARTVSDRWGPLLEPLYTDLAQRHVFFSHVQGGRWVSLCQAVLQRFPQQLPPEVKAAVLKVYKINDENLVDMPEHVLRALNSLGHLEHVEKMNAQRVSRLIPSILAHLTDRDKLSLLHYICRHDQSLLINLPLLPLASGHFGTFESRHNYGSSVKFCCPEELNMLFPGLEAEFCSSNDPAYVREDLERIAETGTLAVEKLTKSDRRIPELLQKSLHTRFGSGHLSLSINDPWIERVWLFLKKMDDLSEFSHVRLLPVKKVERNPLTMFLTSKESLTLLPLTGVYVCSEARGMTPMSASLASALTKLGVTVLHDVPSYVTRHGQVLGHFVHYPTSVGVMKAVQSVSANSSLRTNAVKTFNSGATEIEKKALVQLVHDCSSAKIPVVFKHLRLFKTVTGDLVSIQEVSLIGPEHLPPVSLPRQLLTCTTSEKNAAQKLGAEKLTLYEVVHEIMQEMSSAGWQYSGGDRISLMKYFLQNHTLYTDSTLQSMAKEIEFVSTQSGNLRKVVDLYDPSSSLLQELFHTQHDTLFPSGEFSSREMLQKLQSLGLRGERDVQNDLVSVAKQISDQWSRNQYAAARKMSCGLWNYLKTYGHVVSAATMQSISMIPCLLCLQDDEKPSRVYPASLPLKSSPKLVKPSEMCSNSLLTVVGSVLPILRSSDLPVEIALHLQVKQHPAPADVLQHLKNVTHHFCQEEIIQCRPLLIDIFQCLRPYKSDISVTARLADEKCVLVESGDQFAKPCSLWIEKKESDLNLQPYRFPVPVELTAFRDFLEECGSARSQDGDMLLAVLKEIQSKYKEQRSAHPDFSRDLQLVGQILSRLKLSETARGGNTLLPIEHKQPGVLRFKPARECTVSPGMSATLADSSSETYFYVHRDVAVQTALDLGALLMRDRALTGVEDLGLDFEYGQREDLINRLHGIVKESYTDGFSVPKELIQNADDASATKVCFLLDERENHNARTNLIDEGMSGLQGPAIWAYNNGVFSETDFANIVKLGAGTKKDDASKVGRFGLGFNAVYNLTDVPCFISKDKMAMFDPQCKYLGKGAGLKLDFTKPINKDLLARMPNQFLPFQNVFGCSLQHSAEVSYEGTLFRFPLRTAEQAKGSKLKSESYSESKPREFLKMLLDRAGSLVMFTQSVTELEVFHLPSSCTDPREAKLLLTVRKHNCLPPTVNSGPTQLGEKGVLRFMKDQWSLENRDIKIKQRVKIDLKVTDEANSVCGVKKTESSTMWQVAWASGVDESAEKAHRYRQEGLVPLAAVSVLVSDNSLLALKDSPAGFYDTGHLFCFLPLPEELARVTLPVHINGTFALTSDRRSLVVNIKEEFEKWEASWNCALYGDAICRAYFLVLELVQEEAAGGSDFSKFFDLWPKSSVDSLVDSFYNRLLTGNNKVLPVPGTSQWVTFEDACFLQPDFRDSGCGKTAWLALRQFWRGPSHVVDVPSAICKLMEEKGPKGMFGKKFISELAFYRDFFFPNLQSDWWQPDERDSLIHHALMRRDKDIDELIRANACIPCEGGQQLRTPSELVHPQGQAAKLFLPSECRFPQKKDETQTTSTRTDFCDYNILLSLALLGMIKDEMPWGMVLDRAGTVGQLNVAKKTADCLSRAAGLIEYLSTSRAFDSEFAFENCPSEVKASLSQTAFLPVLSKPDDWPFQWAGGEPAECVLLSPPNQLFSDSLKNLVACKEKLLDTRSLQGSKTLLTGKVREVLKGLGVAVEEDYGRGQLLDAALQQLRAVAEHHCNNPTSNKELVQSISTNVYAYLTTCLRRDEQHNVGEHVHEFLSDKDVVWNGSQFVSSSLVAFVCPFNCSHYLFKLESNLQGYRLFFEAVGVKQRFEASDVLSVLQRLKTKNDGIQIPDETITIVSQLALLLGAITKESLQNESLDKSQVFLPDKHCILQPATRLCVDDCPWLTESEHLKFVHDKIPTETARLLGVKTKRSQDYDMLTESISVPFGQHEELTTRIKRLLQGYTFDSSLCKELLQNAEDAGATECKFIMDFRHLGQDTVPPNWNALQGPALCFYNNKSFTKQDMAGIQNLGVGSKAGDALKIGQFGVGFNAVFHITDVPSFWTKEDDEKEVICVLDPNCTYVPGAQPSKPGKKFIDIQHMKRKYPDFFSAYLNEAIDMNQPGTLFRFPLRTMEMAESSRIKHEAVGELAIKSMLEHFVEEIHPCLLFLNNIQKIGIFSVQTDGSLKNEFEVNKTLDDLSAQQLSTFKMSLKEASRLMENETVSVTDIQPLEAVVQLELTDSGGHREQWLTVNRVGFAEEVCLTPKLQNEWFKENFRLLPRGGVAVKVADETPHNRRQTTSQLNHQAFCILPLPVYTKLPMHVNGHFALDHETRRNLWDAGSHKDDVRSEWNEAIALHVVLPAYITALQQLKDIWFPAGGRDLSKQELSTKLQRYHHLFPLVQDAESELWKQLMHAVYVTVAKNEYPIFPVLCPEQQELEWMPVTKKGGFPAFFNNLVVFFKDLQAKTSHVTLTGGLFTPASHATPRGPSPLEIAKHLEILLKKLYMKILEAPYHVFECFKASGVDDVQEVTPQSVLQFLVSVDQGCSTGCNLDNLPKPVADTSLESPDKVRELVSFVSKGKTFLDNLDGVPLCLRQDGTLHKFSASENEQKPIISKFCHLLPGSAEEFLHEKITKYFNDPQKTQPVLQQLNIEMLACRLKYTLTEPQYCAGKHCELEQEKLPYASWIRDLWKFLESQIKSELQNKCSTNHSSNETAHKDYREEKKIERRELREKAESMLESLREWCVLPVMKKNGTHEKSFLYPVKDMHRVVHLSFLRDETNSRLWEIMRNLPLPMLDSASLPGLSIANDLVASICHPRALLHALVSCVQLSASHKDGCTILDYFGKNLKTLIEMCTDEAELKQELRSLPLFPSVGGNLVSIPGNVSVLCLSPSVPEGGLIPWSNGRDQPVFLLRGEHVPMDLVDYLGFTSLENHEFYSGYLLPTLEALPIQNILIHMTFLNWELCDVDKTAESVQHLVRQLRSAAFVEVQGTLYRAQDFFNPHVVVFAVMCTQDQFPPEPYCTKEWEGFMKAAGIMQNITDGMFVEYAQSVAKEGNPEITQSVQEKSKTLVRHLFSRNDVTKGWLLGDVKDIQFLLPADWRSSREGQELQLIAQPFCQPRLVSFAESCFEQHLRLVWSSSCILSPDADPRNHCYSNNPGPVMQKLGLQQQPSKSKVFQHLKNVSQTLASEGGPEIFVALERNKRQLIIVMEDIYRYLENNMSNSDIPSLSQLPVICDIDNNQMLAPVCVVIDLRPTEMIKGHIEKAPLTFGRYFDLFQKLGVAKCVTANHYAAVLAWLKNETGNEELHVEEMKIVKTAVEGLFRCLKFGDDKQKQIEVPTLYLPTEEKILQKSTDIIYKDSKFGKRLHCRPTYRHFFLGFKLLEINVSTPLEEVALLPKEHRMAMLSGVVKEVIPVETKDNSREGECSQDLMAKLQHPNATGGIIRLMYHTYYFDDRAFDEKSAFDVKGKLAHVSAREITGLKTMLALDGRTIPGSELAKSSFTEKIHGTPRQAVVYLDTETAQRNTGARDASMHSLALAIMFVLNTDLNEFFLNEVLHSPERAMTTLDDYDVTMCDFSHVIEDSVIPTAGTFVPLRHHDHLDNSIYTFYPGEHVGFEVYDPDVEGENREGGDAVYIYAVVLREITAANWSGDVPLIARRYRIYLGKDRGEVEVSVTELYKFKRRARRSTSTALVEYEGQDSEEEFPTDIIPVLKEIRKLLNDTWRQFPNDKDRRRVVKRLLLKWHPDKNPSRQEFCTRVTQKILKYVDILNSGRYLPDDQDLDDVDGAPRRHGSSFPSSFYTHMNARAQSHRAYSESTSSSQSGPSQRSPNPQPGEGRRWLRQAEADVTSAHDARGASDRGRNWICYQCHQAVEKALKAVMYSRDADGFNMMSHNLPQLAHSVGDSELLQLAQDLESRLGPHTRMRYPDVTKYPRVPADEYSEDDVSWACDVASRVVERVRSLI